MTSSWKRTKDGEYLSDDGYRIAPGENPSGTPVYWYVYLHGNYVTGRRTLREIKTVVEHRRRQRKQ
jgi:hypothetical protein